MWRSSRERRIGTSHRPTVSVDRNDRLWFIDVFDIMLAIEDSYPQDPHTRPRIRPVLAWSAPLLLLVLVNLLGLIMVLPLLDKTESQPPSRRLSVAVRGLPRGSRAVALIASQVDGPQLVLHSGPLDPHNNYFRVDLPERSKISGFQFLVLEEDNVWTAFDLSRYIGSSSAELWEVLLTDPECWHKRDATDADLAPLLGESQSLRLDLRGHPRSKRQVTIAHAILQDKCKALQTTMVGSPSQLRSLDSIAELLDFLERAQLGADVENALRAIRAAWTGIYKSLADGNAPAAQLAFNAMNEPLRKLADQLGR